MALTKLTCIVKPFRLDAVMARLDQLEGVQEVLVTEVRGYGRQKGHLDLYRGSEYDLTFLPKVSLEIFVDESDRDAVVREVVQVARTGRIGDGKIFQTGVQQ
jgi:nitrogen regulatory protein PII